LFNLIGSQQLGGPGLLFFSDANGTAEVALQNGAGGLSTVGAVVNRVVETAPGSGQWRVLTIANPNVGGIAGTLSVTDLFIANVVNKPTSPFITGLRGEDNCSSGGFVRGLTGSASITGESANSGFTSETSLKGDYNGFQAGFDYGCFDDFINGWDLRFGLTFGVNDGSLSQSILGFDPLIGVSNTVTGTVVETDFTQNYVGAYTAFVRGSFFGDVQLRFDDTSFALSESGTVATQVGVNGQTYKSTATTIAARLNYSIPVNEAGTIALIPTAGFSHSSVKGGTLSFAGGERLELGDFESTVGFAGLIANIRFTPNEGTFVVPFLGLTYYNDFAGDRESKFFNAGAGANDFEVIKTEGLGGYGELSIGVNYVSDVSKTFGAGSTFSAALRADARVGDNISDAYSLTAQMRLSF
jgi:outer membrane autotransporter protein